MIKRTLSELKPYDAPGHYNMVAMRVHGKEQVLKNSGSVNLFSFQAAVLYGLTKITHWKRFTMY